MKIIPEIIRVNADNLCLDNKNPRLPENVADSKNQEEIREFMKKAYDLDELALSMVTNGYFEAEPLVVIPKDTKFSENQQDLYNTYKDSPQNQYIVVEGNRRLSTIQGLLKNQFKEHPITEELEKQFKNLPVLFYPNKDEVLAFLGVRHLAGVRKWNVYERAQFIVTLKRDQKMPVEDIQRTIGDRKNSAKKTYVCYRLIEIIKDYDGSFNTRDAKSNFSFLQLATGQGPIREFIGLDSWNNIEDLEEPIPKDKKEELKFLFECLFDNGNKRSLIEESRDITKKLSKILDDKKATEIFKNDRNIDNAFNMIGGELEGMNRLSYNAQSSLETVNGKLSSINVHEVVGNHDRGRKTTKTIKAISNIVEDINIKF